MLCWPSADWKIALPLVDAGLMPTLGSLINEGVIADLSSIQPTLDPITAWSAATGCTPDVHGILSWLEPGGADGVRPGSSASRRVPALWHLLNGHGLKTCVAGWPVSHPAEAVDGASISDHFTNAGEAPARGSIYPPHLEESLSGLRIHPDELDPGHVLPFIPRLAAASPEDPRPDLIRRIISDCSSLHAATTWLMEREPWDFFAAYYGLIDRFSFHFMPYHPPAAPGDGELYAPAVIGAYRFQDMMLERLIQLAGEDATVILFSDHGYHSDHLRPPYAPGPNAQAAQAWHRPTGLLCIKGPGFKKDERIWGASILDLVPTALSFYELPIPSDLPGRTLIDAFESPPAVTRASPMRPAYCTTNPSLDPDTRKVMLGSLAGRCLIEDPSPEPDQVRRNCALALAQVHIEARRARQAADLLEPFSEEDPNNHLLRLTLTVAYFTLGDLARCRQLLDGIPDSNVMGAYLRGMIAAADGDSAGALAQLARATEPSVPRLSTEIGNLYLRMRKWPEAERAFQRELESDPASAEAHYGLSVACASQNRFEEAAREASLAVQLRYEFPEAHLQLGLTLLPLNQPLRAAQSLERCLSLRPDTIEAHLSLAAIHEQFTRNKDKAAFHRKRVRSLRAAGRT